MARSSSTPLVVSSVGRGLTECPGHADLKLFDQAPCLVWVKRTEVRQRFGTVIRHACAGYSTRQRYRAAGVRALIIWSGLGGVVCRHVSRNPTGRERRTDQSGRGCGESGAGVRNILLLHAAVAGLRLAR